MEIDREELIEMMLEYWAIDNNKECWIKTKEFLEKYNISKHEVGLSDEDCFE